MFEMGQLKGASRVSDKILFLDLGDNKGIYPVKMYWAVHILGSFFYICFRFYNTKGKETTEEANSNQRIIALETINSLRV